MFKSWTEYFRFKPVEKVSRNLRSNFAPDTIQLLLVQDYYIVMRIMMFYDWQFRYA